MREHIAAATLELDLGARTPTGESRADARLLLIMHVQYSTLHQARAEGLLLIMHVLSISHLRPQHMSHADRWTFHTLSYSSLGVSRASEIPCLA